MSAPAHAGINGATARPRRRPAKVAATPPNASSTPAWPADQVIRKPVADLVPYARNARLHTDEQVDQIVASMREWGFTVPVLVDNKNEIIAGHGRVLAAAKLGLDTVPVMVATGWTKKQVRAYRIADNQLALNSAWDVKMLAADMSDLVEVASLIGFTEGQLQNIFLDRADGETDASAEWTGMPGFNHGDKKAFRSIAFHFPSQKDVDDFVALTGLKITDKTRFVWFPHTTIDRYMDKRYVDDAA